jgi:hypothetical protein
VTDDNDGEEIQGPPLAPPEQPGLPDLPDEPEVQAPAPGLVCPVCGLDACHHNLSFVEKTP